MSSITRLLLPGRLLPLIGRQWGTLLSHWALLMASWPQKSLFPSDLLDTAVSDGLAGRNPPKRDFPNLPPAPPLGTQIPYRGQAGTACVVSSLLAAVRSNPHDENAQTAVARALEDLGDYRASACAWEGIAKRFPGSVSALLGYVTAVSGSLGIHRARKLICRQLAPQSDDFENAILLARAWDAAGDVNKANASLAHLVSSFSQRDDAWSFAASRFESLGLYREAEDVLKRAMGRDGSSPLHAARAHFIRSVLRNLSPGMLDRSPQATRSHIALRNTFQALELRRDGGAPAEVSRPLSIVMVIGSLGAGGAERQLVNTLRGLRAISPERIGTIRVVAESCRTRPGDSFFRPQIQELGIAITEYEDLPLFGGNFALSAVRPIARTLRLLPSEMIQSVVRLSDALRIWKPDVVQIWQETCIVDTALAALLARVPRILLSLRSVPAPDRPERYRPEYPIVLRALSTIKNVTLSCNSQNTALKYAKWLEIDHECIKVIPNGVDKLSDTGDPPSLVMFESFESHTEGSCLTIGTVMRMDGNKRPLLWMKTAQKVLAQLPSSRFILVGDGPQRLSVARWAQQHGIAHRCLFVGPTKQVGYWLSKMDLFMLLSRQEGMPNALIEAQLSGLPAVITPAGGAAEALIPGVTGVVSTADPTPEEVADLVLGLASNRERLVAMGEAAANWSQHAFAIDRMVEKTMAAMYGREFREESSGSYVN